MANIQTMTRLINPARRATRRRATRKNPRKRLSLKQRLAGFGGKRSQSAAKAVGRRKNAPRRSNASVGRRPARRGRRNIAAGYYSEDDDGVYRFHPIRASDDYSRARAGEKPKRKKRSKRKKTTRRRNTARRATRRGNPSEIITLGLVNPAPKKRRRKRAVAKRKPRRSYRRNSSTRRSRRRNSVARARRANPYRRRRSYRRKRRYNARRRNPARGIGQLGGMLTSGAYLVAGMVATRAATQMFLQTRNVGMLGYGANLVAAVVIGGLASRFANREAGRLVTLGGIGATVLRLIQDFTPMGGYVQQQLALSGIQGDVGMGFLEPTTFFVPLAPADGRGANNAQMALPSAVRSLAAPPPANGGNNSGMQGYYGRGGSSRFSGSRF